MKSRFWLASLLLISSPAFGDERGCDDQMTLDQCWFALTGTHYESPSDPVPVPAAAPARSMAAIGADGVADEVKDTFARLIGGQDAAGSGIDTGAKDLLSFLAATIENAQLDEKTDQLTLTWNPDLSKPRAQKNWQLQYIVRTPEVYQAIQDKIPESGRTDRVAALKKDLGSLDDTTFSVTYSPQNEMFGKDFEAHRAWYTAVFRQLTRNIDNLLAPSEDAIDRLIQLGLDPDIAATANILDFAKMAKLSPQFVIGTIRKGVEARRGASTAVAIDMVEGFMGGQGMTRFEALLANQRQLTLTLSRDLRDPLVGHEGTSLKFSYQSGFRNLAGLFRKLRKNDRDSPCYLSGNSTEFTKNPESSEDCLDIVRDYTQDSSLLLRKAKQFTLSAEYQDFEPLSFSAPGTTTMPDPIQVAEVGYRAIRVSASYGQIVSFDKDGEPSSRLDLTLKYDDVGNDAKLNDRGVASAVYTFVISEQSELPLALSYANHGRYLEDKENQISAHFALSYKLRDRKKD